MAMEFLDGVKLKHRIAEKRHIPLRLENPRVDWNAVSLSGMLSWNPT
jgi:hypothetical protein